MPSLKLVYFDGKGRGEPIRWILAAGGQSFEQEKFSFEQWPAKKPSEYYDILIQAILIRFFIPTHWCGATACMLLQRD